MTPPESGRVAADRRRLAAEYLSVTGCQPIHFYCPFLYVDEETELCAGHLVNAAFGVSNTWVTQRKDVDDFFGAMFESEFVDAQHRGRDLAHALADPDLPRSLRPEILVDGRKVPHYIPNGPVPAGHSKLIVEGPNGERTLALKAPPSELTGLETNRWQLVWERDLRIPATVSLLKAAHLTLFKMLGYRHVFSTGGRFLGNDILGSFVRRCRGLPKKSVLSNAQKHFPEFARLVRPTHNVIPTFRGTPDEHVVYVCERGNIPWGLVAMIRTSEDEVHSVLTPLMETPVAAKIFLDFLRRDSAETLTMRLAWYRGERWEASTQLTEVRWPETGPIT